MSEDFKQQVKAALKDHETSEIEKRKRYEENVLDFLRKHVNDENLRKRSLKAAAAGYKQFNLVELFATKTNWRGKILWDDISTYTFMQLVEKIVNESEFLKQNFEFTIKRQIIWEYYEGFFYARKKTIYGNFIVVDVK